MNKPLYFSLSFSVFLSLLFSLVMPFRLHNMYNNGTNGNPYMDKENLELLGSDFAAAYIPILAVLCCMILVLVKTNLFTGILNFVFSVALILFMVFFTQIMLQEINLENGEYSTRISYGLVVTRATLFVYMLISLIHLVLVSVNTKSLSPKRIKRNDVLIDNLDF